MQSMRYISRVPAGYLVRKTVNGKLHQGFFGDVRYGDKDKALVAAQEYRDGLLKEISGERTFQSHNVRNITGIVGVSWHCRPNPNRKDGVVHAFRAQVAGDESGKTISKAWSVQRYGLWGAYEQAARWRLMVAFGKPANQNKLVKSFAEFLKGYIAEMEQGSEMHIEMRDALVQLALDFEAPKEALSMLPGSIQRRFEVRPARAAKSSLKNNAVDSGGSSKAGLKESAAGGTGTAGRGNAATRSVDRVDAL